jgi:hypothetical protein
MSNGTYLTIYYFLKWLIVRTQCPYPLNCVLSHANSLNMVSISGRIRKSVEISRKYLKALPIAPEFESQNKQRNYQTNISFLVDLVPVDL